MKKVVIIQRVVKFYQVSFFILLKKKLEENGIELIIIYGTDDKIKFNDAELSGGIKINNYNINLFGKKLFWQPINKYIKDADLIIVEQASKLLINYYLWILNFFGFKKLAFWGHGINFQTTNSNIIAESVKKFMTKKVYWFFAYNDLTKNILERMDYPTNRITSVYNTIDVESILDSIKYWGSEELNKIKNELGIESNNICLFVGGMYEEKRLDFLIDSLFIIKKEIPDFHFIFIGDGPDKNVIINIVSENKWMHYLGFKNELAKVPFCMISKLLMIPSLVGLSVIDSFVFEMPLVTTDSIGHGPEIDYLENGKNGVITKDNVKNYSSAIIDLLLNDKKRLLLVEGCSQSANKYTLNNMVEKFYEGITECLYITN